MAFESILQAFPQHAESWHKLGQIRGTQQRKSAGNPEKEQQDLLNAELRAKLKCLALAPTNCDVLNDLATALITNNDTAAAAEYMLQATELCEWDDLAWRNLALALSLQRSANDAREVKTKHNATRVHVCLENTNGYRMYAHPTRRSTSTRDDSYEALHLRPCQKGSRGLRESVRCRLYRRMLTCVCFVKFDIPTTNNT